MRQILGIKSSNGLIRVQQKIVLRSSLKQIYGFLSEASEFHGRSNISLFPSNRPLWTPQCRVCLSTISLSLSPAEDNFVVESRLAMIHVCTSNENAYQERRVSYLRGIFDGLK